MFIHTETMIMNSSASLCHSMVQHCFGSIEKHIKLHYPVFLVNFCFDMHKQACTTNTNVSVCVYLRATNLIFLVEVLCICITDEDMNSNIRFLTYSSISNA